ncbi:MAG: TylF/MycF/NovP-related O-methyltransferase [Calothrix sp. MO_192.B10]|nr:TylF/MycF/NovP-related O-methyltransferase [Calothrix sp. MO_192.B10]
MNYETNLPAQGIQDLVSQLNFALELEGNIIECGSSRCGGTLIMANFLKEKCIHKIIYACDSYEGFDPDEFQREKEAGLTTVSNKVFTSTSFEYVKAKIEKLGMKDMVVPVKGFFQETLANIDEQFCFALIDCDLQESIIYCAEMIWPKLTKGGRILFDDYTAEKFQSARIGIDSFVRKYESDIAEHGLLNHLYLVTKA